MNKKHLTKELISIANELDNMKFYAHANTMTRIAHIVVAEDNMKHDPMVFNPDETFESEHQENQGDAYNDAMAALHELMESGELSQSDFNQIESILKDDTHEMSFDEGDDDMEHSLGLGAVPHTRIKNKSDYDDYDFDDDDYDIRLSDDDEDPELNYKHAWQYDDDESDLDDMEHKQRRDYSHHSDFDDF